MKGVFVALVAAAICAPVADADDLSVYVGYADSLRPSPFFPVPWLGDPNVVSQSPASQTFDSGAIRIDNTGTTAITITNLTVELDAAYASPYFFSIWAPLTINPGQIGIFAQNNFSDAQFDTSDYGFLTFAQGNANVAPGSPYGGCTNPDSPAQAALCMANAPIITFTENGTAPFSYQDTGNVLDTFGYDLNHLNGSDGNESINWNLVGAPVNRGAPEPATVALLGAGLAILGFARKLRTKL